MKEYIAGAIFGIIIVTAGSWVNGYDFNIRGVEAFATYLFSLCFSVIGIIIVYMLKDKNIIR